MSAGDIYNSSPGSGILEINPLGRGYLSFHGKTSAVPHGFLSVISRARTGEIIKAVYTILFYIGWCEAPKTCLCCRPLRKSIVWGSTSVHRWYLQLMHRIVRSHSHWTIIERRGSHLLKGCYIQTGRKGGGDKGTLPPPHQRQGTREPLPPPSKTGDK